jgi:hypothetical protein
MLIFFHVVKRRLLAPNLLVVTTCSVVQGINFHPRDEPLAKKKRLC